MTGQRVGEAYFIEDEASFAVPRREAIAECVNAFGNASKKVKGAEARLNAAIADLEAIDTFGKEVERLIGSRAFLTLPEFKRDGRRVEGFHHLTVGPWRGVFLVDSGGADVAAILFSREPHALESRLGEVMQAYQPSAQTSGPANG